MIATYNPGELWVIAWIGLAALAYFPLEGLRRRLMHRWDERKVRRD